MDRFTIVAVKVSFTWMIAGFIVGGLLMVDHFVPGDWRRWLQPTHGHMLFVGWFVQFVIGIAFWLLPRKRLPELPLGYGEHKAFFALGCLNTGLLFRVLAEPIWRTGSGGRLVDTMFALSATLQVLAIIVFVSQMWPRVYGKGKLGVPPAKKK